MLYDLENNASDHPFSPASSRNSKEKLSSEASFDQLWRKVAAIKTSLVDRINIMARDGAEAQR